MWNGRGEKAQRSATARESAPQSGDRPNPNGLGALGHERRPAHRQSLHHHITPRRRRNRRRIGRRLQKPPPPRRPPSAASTRQNSTSSVHTGAVIVSGTSEARCTPDSSVAHGAHSFPPHGSPRSDSPAGFSPGQHSSTISPGNAAAIAQRFVETTNSSARAMAKTTEKGRMTGLLSNQTPEFCKSTGGRNTAVRAFVSGAFRLSGWRAGVGVSRSRW